MKICRRQFLSTTAAACAVSALPPRLHAAGSDTQAPFQLGLVTYLWGKNASLPQLLQACSESGVLGLELRTTHAHGVEPELSVGQRNEVRSRFADSTCKLVGLGSNEHFDSPDPAQVKTAIERSKSFLQLSHDVGSSGVKVKGDRFHPDVPREKTIEQVCNALRQLGDAAADLNQEVRLEVHGGFSDLKVHHEIIQQTQHPRVRTCWNSNAQDLTGDGLVANFERVQDHMGSTAHIRNLEADGYPWDELFALFTRMNYGGWLLIEAHQELPPDQLTARLAEQVPLFESLKRKAPSVNLG